jgi:hypothetical protein
VGDVEIQYHRHRVRRVRKAGPHVNTGEYLNT